MLHQYFTEPTAVVSAVKLSTKIPRNEAAVSQSKFVAEQNRNGCSSLCSEHIFSEAETVRLAPNTITHGGCQQQSHVRRVTQ